MVLVRALVRPFVVVAAIGLSACGGDPPPAAPTPAPPALVRVDIVVPPSNGLGVPGDTLQLGAVATFADGSRVDVTNESDWSVVNRAVLSVNARGLVTAVGYGASIVGVSYRGRAGETNLGVSHQFAPHFSLTGVVLDAETGAPIVGAFVRTTGAVVGLNARPTDGNGFFDLGAAAGPVGLTVTAFGYADGALTLPDVSATTSVRVRLAPNGNYVERRIEERFESFQEFTATHRILTRAGGTFDAVVNVTCGDRGGTVLEARSGAMLVRGTSVSIGCDTRVRFIVPEEEVQLTVRGTGRGYVLTFREPR